jgi:hypothetical protein
MATFWESTVMSLSEGWDAKYWEMDGYELGYYCLIEVWRLSIGRWMAKY